MKNIKIGKIALDKETQASIYRIQVTNLYMWSCTGHVTMNDEASTELQYRLGKIQSSLKDIDNRLLLLENLNALSNSVENSLELFNSLSPKQHAILQLLLMGHSNSAIGGRLGTTPAGGKSAVTHLMSRLGVSSRRSLRAVYTSVFDNACKDNYLSSNRIDKSWGTAYGLMELPEAEALDPFHAVIVKTRYRSPGNLNKK